jgi:eukaryotic-like serine/threonine-protein kinase
MVLSAIKPGFEIDGFRIGDEIHSGGMGTIYRVERDGDPAPMIMKVPRVGPGEPVEAIVAFETEATIVATLTGEHVPRFVAAGDVTKMPYLVTEWVEGENLDKWIAQGPLPVQDVVRVGAAIADALHSLHQQDVVHLDVKPSNIIIKHDGVVVLIDYGFAHHARYPDLLAEETRFGAGSAPYVSPEQLLTTRNDPRSDIFSLGVVLYEIATGRFPFGEPDTDVRNRLWLDPIPPAIHNTAIPPWLQEIILRCLEPRAEERYQSAALVAFDLRYPEQITLTARATKSSRTTFMSHVRRFMSARREYGRRQRFPNAQVSRSPIIMVAINTVHLDDERHAAMQRVTGQILSLSAEFRLICVSVVPPSSILTADAAESGSALQLEHRIRLRHWADPLAMPAQRLSLHVMESSKPAAALVDFARFNHVDLIVLGAPRQDEEHTWSDSVASGVTANAQCSVHVVRVPQAAGP